MEIKDFSDNFPNGTNPPLELLKLLDYQNNNGIGYSGDFSLISAGKLTATRYFDGHPIASTQIAVFGCSKDGSIYGYWLYAGQTLETAPIVFLGHEGDCYNVLANSTREFMGLLGLGIEELGFEVSESGWSNKVVYNNKVERFRKWLMTYMAISVPENPEEIVRLARQSHPDLKDWVGQQFSSSLYAPTEKWWEKPY